MPLEEPTAVAAEYDAAVAEEDDAAVAGDDGVASLAAVAGTSLEPVLTTVATGSMKKWKPVEIIDASIAISGGFNNKGPTLANVIRYAMGGKTWTFVELIKAAPWFTKGVAGDKAQKGDLPAVEVINTIRENASATRS